MKAVNLGLSVLWGDCNMGAIECYEKGALYTWKEIVPEVDRLTALRAPVAIPDSMKSDIAERTYGHGWHVPTIEQIIEFMQNCEFELFSASKLLKATGPNGNSIHLPLAGNEDWHGNVAQGGFYWSSTKAKEDNDSAYQLRISEEQLVWGYNNVNVRQCVRPVYSPISTNKKNYNKVDNPIPFRNVKFGDIKASLEKLCKELRIQFKWSEIQKSDNSYRKFPVATSKQVFYLEKGNSLGHGNITFLYSGSNSLVAILIEKASKEYIESVKNCGMVYGFLYASVTYGEDYRPDLMNKLDPDDVLVWLI